MNKTTMTRTAAPVDQTDAAALDAIETALQIGSLDAKEALQRRFRRTSLRSTGRPSGASAIWGGRSAGSTRRSSPLTSCVSRTPGLSRRSSQCSCPCHLPQTATARPSTGKRETKRTRRPARSRRRRWREGTGEARRCCSPAAARSTSEVTESGVTLPQDDLRRDELIGLIGDVLGIALALRQRHRLADASEQWLLTNDDIEDEAAA